MIHNKENDQLEHQLFSSPTTPVSANNNSLLLNSASPLSVYKPQLTVPTLAMTNLTNNGNNTNNNNSTASKGLNNTLSKFIKI